MKVAIVGTSRAKLDISPYVPPETTAIISGGAKGIDSLAEAYADKHHIPKLIFRPSLFARSKKLPYLRHESIVKSADKVIAIWDGASKGTKYIIDYAQKIGVPVQVIMLEAKK